MLLLVVVVGRAISFRSLSQESIVRSSPELESDLVQVHAEALSAENSSVADGHLTTERFLTWQEDRYPTVSIPKRSIVDGTAIAFPRPKTHKKNWVMISGEWFNVTTDLLFETGFTINPQGTYLKDCTLRNTKIGGKHLTLKSETRPARNDHDQNFEYDTNDWPVGSFSAIADLTWRTSRQRLFGSVYCHEMTFEFDFQWSRDEGNGACRLGSPECGFSRSECVAVVFTCYGTFRFPSCSK